MMMQGACLSNTCCLGLLSHLLESLILTVIVKGIMMIITQCAEAARTYVARTPCLRLDDCHPTEPCLPRPQLHQDSLLTTHTGAGPQGEDS
jgi:hypothetical protein